ncbi:hypothetical protein RRG08_016730 [Elysia crispata]|uniref:Uncharacterized protein n=1 Tax=Elysia crispata TaxID=231223 RepID=A0AAE0YQS8_9GAST|nr:hypothetical protein RRG08_016730 [Elysia crispata]
MGNHQICVASHILARASAYDPVFEIILGSALSMRKKTLYEALNQYPNGNRLLNNGVYDSRGVVVKLCVLESQSRYITYPPKPRIPNLNRLDLSCPQTRSLGHFTSLAYPTDVMLIYKEYKKTRAGSIFSENG